MCLPCTEKEQNEIYLQNVYNVDVKTAKFAYSRDLPASGRELRLNRQFLTSFYIFTAGMM